MAAALSLALAACSPAGTPSPTQAAGSTESPGLKLSGDIIADGSSTVFPITEAMAEEFGNLNPDVRVSVGESGTGGGFKKFCNNETDISDASRPIKDSEKELCAAAGVEYVEFKIGLDGITVVVNPANQFAACLTTDQLKALWNKDSTVDNWNQVDPSFPDQPITLYGPGTDSGTFDFFTEVINGEAKSSRADYTASEDDNVLVQGIAGDPNALGYFGLAYFVENQDKLQEVAVNAGGGCVSPSYETVADASYQPLSRPLFIYVKKSALARPELFEFVKFYLQNAPAIVKEVGYINVDQSVYDADLQTLEGMK
jgi:phosphate transport system substrate-binding protein